MVQRTDPSETLLDAFLGKSMKQLKPAFGQMWVHEIQEEDIAKFKATVYAIALNTS
jgi:hypothetical protein